MLPVKFQGRRGQKFCGHGGHGAAQFSLRRRRPRSVRTCDVLGSAHVLLPLLLLGIIAVVIVVIVVEINLVGVASLGRSCGLAAGFDKGRVQRLLSFGLCGL